MVNIYYLKTSDLKLDFDFSKVLSKTRKEKLNSISNEELRVQSICAELLLQYAFKEYGFDIPKQYEYLGNGKPVSSDVFFSITHTKGAVMVAVANNVVGIDLEKKKDLEPLLAKKILTKDEFEFYQNNQAGEYLLDSFVRKESYFKMTGEGIGNNLTKESVDDILNSSKQVALCFDDYLSIITTKQKDLYDVTKVNIVDLIKMTEEVEDEKI